MSMLVFPSELRQRQPRVKDAKHLAFIRTLPCAVRGTLHYIEAAHVRAANIELGKRQCGMQEKPDDCWTVPLCADLHREQHSMNEMAFWQRVGIDPFALSQALYAVSGKRDDALGILANPPLNKFSPIHGIYEVTE